MRPPVWSILVGLSALVGCSHEVRSDPAASPSRGSPRVRDQLSPAVQEWNGNHKPTTFAG